MYQKTEAVPDEVSVCMCVCTCVLPLIMQKGPNPLIMCFSPYSTRNKSWSVIAHLESQSYYHWHHFCIRTDNTQWIIFSFLYVLYIYSCLLHGKNKYHLQEAGLNFYYHYLLLASQMMRFYSTQHSVKTRWATQHMASSFLCLELGKIYHKIQQAQLLISPWCMQILRNFS